MQPSAGNGLTTGNRLPPAPPVAAYAPVPAPVPTPAPTPPAPAPAPTPAPITVSALNPVSDGAVCIGCDRVADDGYLVVAGDTHGLVKFAAVAGGGVTQALLSLSHYAHPVYAHDVRVYGFGAGMAQLAASEQGGGTLLGTLHMQSTEHGGTGDERFDVTGFVRATAVPYLGFRLEAADEFGLDILGSMEYGRPAQLILAQVPEPGEAALLCAGLLTLAGWLRRRRAA